MSLLSGLLNQTATYWAPSGVNSSGDVIFAAPVVIKVRWEDSQKLMTDGEGRARESLATVFTAMDLSERGYLLLGTSTDTDPRELNEAFEIQAFIKSPSFAADEFVRKAIV